MDIKNGILVKGIGLEGLRNLGDPESFIKTYYDQKIDEIHGQADLLIMKQRHGPTGNIKLSFDAKYTRFGNFIGKDHVENYD